MESIPAEHWDHRRVSRADNPQNPKKKDTLSACLSFLEVTPGFEPGNEGFADPCLTTWLCHQLYSIICGLFGKVHPFLKKYDAHTVCVGIASGAGNEARTRYLHLGKVALYQMSYARRWCPEPESNQRHEDFQSSALPTELSGQTHRAVAPWLWRPGTGSNRRPLA